jgi:thiol-disulfide isomerase/thioredoxin
MEPINNPYLAHDFTLPGLQGKTIRLSDFRGQYVLINFWAVWCYPCIKELPIMQTMYEALQEKDFELLAIHVGPLEIGPLENGDTSYLPTDKFGFKIVIDESMNIRGWDVPVLPVSYLVDPRGYLIYKALGPREWNSVEMRNLMLLD